MAELFEFAILLVGMFVVPILLEHSNMKQMRLLKENLRVLWTVVFAFLLVYFLSRPHVVEVVVGFRNHLSPAWLGYVVVGTCGTIVFCAYWFFIGRLERSVEQEPGVIVVPHHEVPLITKAPLSPPHERLKPIIKTDTFTTIVPINEAAPKVPIPQDENLADPRRDFYLDLSGLALVPENATAANWPVHEPRAIATDDERFKFATRLIQFYLLQKIAFVHRGRRGIRMTFGEGGGTTPLGTKPVVPPDSTKYPPDKLLRMLNGNEFLVPSAKMGFEYGTFNVPVGTTIRVLQENGDPKQGKLFTCIIELESPKRYKLDLTIQPSFGAGLLPAKFQTQAAATTHSYSVDVTMHAEISREKTEDFDPDEYVAWVGALFDALEKGMEFSD